MVTLNSPGGTTHAAAATGTLEARRARRLATAGVGQPPISDVRSGHSTRENHPARSSRHRRRSSNRTAASRPGGSRGTVTINDVLPVCYEELAI